MLPSASGAAPAPPAQIPPDTLDTAASRRGTCACAASRGPSPARSLAGACPVRPRPPGHGYSAPHKQFSTSQPLSYRRQPRRQGCPQKPPAGGVLSGNNSRPFPDMAAPDRPLPSPGRCCPPAKEGDSPSSWQQLPEPRSHLCASAGDPAANQVTSRAPVTPAAMQANSWPSAT